MRKKVRRENREERCCLGFVGGDNITIWVGEYCAVLSNKPRRRIPSKSGSKAHTSVPVNGETEWTGWEEGGSKCPRCKSSNTSELDLSSDEIVAGKMHCNDCGFEGRSYIY